MSEIINCEECTHKTCLSTKFNNQCWHDKEEEDENGGE
jgi:hypothetical protein